MSERRWDAELDELIAADPETQRVSRLLKAGRLHPAPLDPRFKQDLRRKLMDEAYERLPARPSIFSRLFGAPGLALAATAAGAFLLVAALYVLHAGTGTSNPNVYIDNTKPVAVDQPITVKFSQPVPESQHQAVEQAIQIQPATQVTYTWSGNDLLIKPVDGSFAGDTQYHVILPAAATGTSKQADLTFRTQPAPSPPPVAPSPVPPSLAIISNNLLAKPANSVIGWTYQHQVVYLAAPAGDLVVVGGDGSNSRTLASLVTFAAVSPDGTQVLFATKNADVELVTATGGQPQVLARAEALGVYWLGSRPAYRTADALYSGDSKLFALPADTTSVWPAPDGSKVIYQLGQSGVAGWSLREADLPGGTGKQWPLQAPAIAWSPDSSRVAYATGSGVFVAAPDGSGSKAVLSAAGAGAEIRWVDAQTLFVNSNEGTYLVGADGSDRIQLASNATGSGAVFDGSTALALISDGALQVLKIGPATGLDLQAGNAVVKAFEDARVAGDATSAGRQLDASAARSAPPLVPAGQPHLSRWFSISAQAVANNPASLRYVVRLVYASDRSEVRWQDEMLTLVAGPGGGLVVDAISDTPPVSLTGPQVIGVQVQAGKVVVAFDSDLNPSSVPGAFHVLGADGKELPVATTYAARTVTIEVSLTAGKHYTLVIDPTLRDVAGGTPPQSYRQDLFGQ